MKIVKKIIKLENKDEPLTIIPLGDIHVGSANCDKTKLKELIEWIKNKENCFVIGMGDYCDAININDKRFRFSELDPYFQSKIENLGIEQVRYSIELLKPIKEKILVMIPGNHEESFIKYNSIDLIKELCAGLNVERGDYMTYLKLDFDRSQFHKQGVVFWLHHGWFAGRKKGGKVNNLEDIAAGWDADIYCAGHSHELFATSTTRMSIVGDNLVENKKIFCNTGTFMKTISIGNSSYSEKKAYRPTKIGVLRIDIKPRKIGKPDIHVRE
jgi:predicted phosphodiesterase